MQKGTEVKIIEIDLSPNAGLMLSAKESEPILSRLKKQSSSIRTAVQYQRSPRPRSNWLAKGNLALVPTSADVIVVNLPEGRLPVKKLYLYQFSGLVTTPADNGNATPYFSRIVKSFLSFILFPVNLVVNAWTEFFKFILGQGSPTSITKGWIAESDLEKVIVSIPKIHKPKTPKSFLPSVPARQTKYSAEEAGLGIWVQPDLNNPRLVPLIDPQRLLSAHINEPVHHVVFQFKNGQPKRLYFSWLSNKYDLNDGSCYGSFIYSENNQ